MWILTNKEQAMEIETASPKASNTKATIARSPAVTREAQFARTAKARKMLEKVPDVSNTLVKTEIDPMIRGRLVGWIVEVLQTLHTSLRYDELFRTILVMDLFMKHAAAPLDDEDIHLIGVTSMFISSKYETNKHLCVDELTLKACHGKFTNSNIFEHEFTILKTLGFNVSFPSHFDVLRLFLYELFEGDNPVFRTIEHLSNNFLLFCLMDVHFNNYLMDDLAIAIVVTSVKYYYSCKMASITGALSFGKVENFSKQESMIVGQIYQYSGNAKNIEILVKLIGRYLQVFKQKYGDCVYAIRLFDYNADLIGK